MNPAAAAVLGPGPCPAPTPVCYQLFVLALRLSAGIPLVINLVIKTLLFMTITSDVPGVEGTKCTNNLRAAHLSYCFAKLLVPL